MVGSCCVPFCKSQKRKSSDVSFHEFPCNEDLRVQWLRNVARRDWEPTDRSFVCSLHFDRTDYKEHVKNRILKPTAVPTIFPNYPSYLVEAARKSTGKRKPPATRSAKRLRKVEDEQTSARRSNTASRAWRPFRLPVVPIGRRPCPPEVVSKRLRAMQGQVTRLVTRNEALETKLSMAKETLKQMERYVEPIRTLERDVETGDLGAIRFQMQLLLYGASRYQRRKQLNLYCKRPTTEAT